MVRVFSRVGEFLDSLHKWWCPNFCLLQIWNFITKGHGCLKNKIIHCIAKNSLSLSLSLPLSLCTFFLTFGVFSSSTSPPLSNMSTTFCDKGPVSSKKLSLKGYAPLVKTDILQNVAITKASFINQCLH